MNINIKTFEYKNNIYIQINKKYVQLFYLLTNVKHKTSNYPFVPKRRKYLKNITKT